MGLPVGGKALRIPLGFEAAFAGVMDRRELCSLLRTPLKLLFLKLSVRLLQ